MRPRFHLAWLLLLLGLISSLTPSTAAAGERVATILIQGLQRIDRAQLLEDLALAEGDELGENYVAELEARGGLLPYLRSFRVESRLGQRGLHLTLKVREARRINFAPYAMVLDDGDLDGGLIMEGLSILGRSERWLGRVLVGSYAEGSLVLRDLRLARGLPSLDAEIGVSDYDDPFIESTVTRWWGLAGPVFHLPGRGRLSLRVGGERVRDRQSDSLTPEATVSHLLSRLELQQELGGRGLLLLLDAELRNPGDRRGHARGVAALMGRRKLGRWRLESKLSAGLASHWSPVTDIHHLAAWRYLRAYEPGDFPAREFQAGRLRVGFQVARLPIRMRRGARASRAELGPYFILDAARFREYRHQDFASAWDWGLGLSLLLPTRNPLRASFGAQWDEEGNRRTVFLLEER
jgi:hypothetical protein